MIHRRGWLGAPIMIGNTSGFPVGIPLGVYALLWSRNLETPTRVRRQPLGPAYAHDGPGRAA
jgi:hypothetical protein